MSTPSDETGESKGYVIINQPPVWNEMNHQQSVSLQREESVSVLSAASNQTEEGQNQQNMNVVNNRGMTTNPKRRSSLRRTSLLESIDFSIVFDAKQNYNSNESQHNLSNPKSTTFITRKLQRRTSR